MKIKKLLPAIMIYASGLFPAYAEEIDLPAIINSQPQKSISEEIEVQDEFIIDQEKKINSRPVIFNSLLFDTPTAEKLEAAHNTYSSILSTRQLDDSGGNLRMGQRDQQQMAPALPQPVRNIYLSSIIYENKDGIAIWINGEKFRVGDTNKGVKVLSALPDKVQLVYNLSGYSFDFNDPRVMQNPEVKVDKEKKELTFWLMPNHRLDLNVMGFFAGRAYNMQLPPGVTPVGAVQAPPPQQFNRRVQLQPGLQRPNVILPTPLDQQGNMQPGQMGRPTGMQQRNPNVPVNMQGNPNMNQRPIGQLNNTIDQQGNRNTNAPMNQQMAPGVRNPNIQQNMNQQNRQMQPGAVMQQNRPAQPVNMQNPANRGPQPQMNPANRGPQPANTATAKPVMQVNNPTPKAPKAEVAKPAVLGAEMAGTHPVAVYLSNADALTLTTADPKKAQLAGYAKSFNTIEDPIVKTIVRFMKSAKSDDDINAAIKKLEVLKKDKEAKALKEFLALAKAIPAPSIKKPAPGQNPSQPNASQNKR